MMRRRPLISLEAAVALCTVRKPYVAYEDTFLGQLDRMIEALKPSKRGPGASAASRALLIHRA